jgi:hypothetical protein
MATLSLARVTHPVRFDGLIDAVSAGVLRGNERPIECLSISLSLSLSLCVDSQTLSRQNEKKGGEWHRRRRRHRQAKGEKT